MGEELRFLRIELDLSQRRLGEYLGKSDQSVALWEKTGNLPEEVDFLIRHGFSCEELPLIHRVQPVSLAQD